MIGNQSSSGDRRLLVSFGRGLARSGRRRLGLVVAVVLATAITEGIGLLLLVPLLGSVGLDVGASLGGLARAAAAAFHAVGLTPGLPSILLAYAAIVTSRALLQRWESLEVARLSQRIAHRLRTGLYDAVLSTSWTWFVRRRASDYTHALTTELQRVEDIAPELLRLVTQVLLGGLYLALALRVSLPATVFAGVCGFGLQLGLRRWNARAREEGEQLTLAGNELFATVGEHLGGLKTVKTHGAEPATARVFEGVSGRLAAAYVGTVHSYATVSAAFEIGSVVVLAVAVYVSRAMLGLGTAEILLLLFLFARLVPRFSTIQHSWQYTLNALPAYGTVIRTIHDCEAHAEGAPGRGACPPVQHGIDLVNVSFRHVEEDDCTISDLTLHIPALSTTAIIGSSGAGKSTLADILLGLLRPEEGEVRVDGRALTDDWLGAWRDRIGYVGQEPFLFHASIRENLLWAKPHAAEADCWRALELAAVDDFVRGLPRSLDTMVGDRGSMLSGGERQRICLARALLREPEVLILDEATSALDSANEAQILGALRQLGGRLTIVMISHRLSAIRDAALIHVVEAGALVESGSWQELMRLADGRLGALAAAQGVARAPYPGGGTGAAPDEWAGPSSVIRRLHELARDEAAVNAAGEVA